MSKKMGFRLKDKFDILEQGTILALFGETKKESIENYYRVFLKGAKEKVELNFKNEKTEYRSYRKVLLRNVDEQEIIKYVFGKFNMSNAKIHIKNNKRVSDAKALSVAALRKFAGKSDKEIANIIGDITQARVSQLCHEGLNLINNDKKWDGIFEELIAGA